MSTQNHEAFSLNQSQEKSRGVGAFVDVETTGLSPRRDEIVELALCLFLYDKNNGQILKIIEEYSGLREPERSIPKRVSEIHGIYDEDVQGKRLNKKLIKRYLGYAEFLAAHNAQFDKGFVCKYFPEASHKPWLCSMKHINWRRKGFSSRKLQSLIKLHNIQSREAHRAASDVRVAVKLIGQTDKDGKTYLYEMLQNLQRDKK